jgi:hypothetical protein
MGSGSIRKRVESDSDPVGTFTFPNEKGVNFLTLLGFSLDEALSLL